LKTQWDGAVYKKIHIIKEMKNVINDGYDLTVSWGSIGTTTDNRVFLTDAPEFTSYAALFD